MDEHFGARKDLLLMDNNVFASEYFDRIIYEIKDCGFAKGAKYQPSDEYGIAILNIRNNYNVRGYLKNNIYIRCDCRSYFR